MNRMKKSILRSTLLALAALLLLTVNSVAQTQCSEAVTVSAGTNHIPATENYEYWTHYTMSNHPDQKLIVEGPASVYYTVYKNTCGYLQYIGAGYEIRHIAGITEGDDVYISWTTYGAATLTLAFQKRPYWKEKHAI
jgi:hypothetical protein